MKTKDGLIQDYLNETIKIGDPVTVRGLGIQNKNEWGTTTKVTKLGRGECIY